MFVSIKSVSIKHILKSRQLVRFSIGINCRGLRHFSLYRISVGYFPHGRILLPVISKVYPHPPIIHQNGKLLNYVFCYKQGLKLAQKKTLCFGIFFSFTKFVTL